MALTRIDSYLVDLDSLGGITFDDQAGTPTFKVDAVNHRVGIGTTSPATTLDIRSSSNEAIYIRRSDNQGAYGLLGISGSNIFRLGSYVTGSGWGDISFNDQIRFTSTGNVGIGMTNPGAQVQIVASSNTEPLRLRATTASYNYFTHLHHSSGDIAYFGAGGGAALTSGTSSDYAIRAQQGALIFATNGDNERLRVTSSGNVGIGTGSPTYKLDVNGTFGFTSNENSPVDKFIINKPGDAARYWTVFQQGTGFYRFGMGAAPYNLELWHGLNSTASSPGSQLLAISTGGNVGIGTTNPQKPLEAIVSASDYVSIGVSTLNLSQWSGIHFGYRENNNAYRKSVLAFERIDGAARGKIHILNNNDNNSNSATLSDSRLTIQSDGNVGIGTTNPTSILQVQGTGQFVSDSSNSATSIAAIYASTPLQTVSAFFGRIASVAGLTGDQYSTSIRFNGSDIAWGDISYYPNQGGRGHFRFSLAGSSVDTFPNAKIGVGSLYSSGNVGIGTANPGALLHTYGKTRFGNNFNYYGEIDHDASVTGANIYNSVDTGGHIFQRNGNELFCISASGNVGIGTTNPQAKLDVAGGVLTTSLTVSNGVRAATIGDYSNVNGELPNPAILIGTSGSYPLSLIGDGSNGSTSGGIVASYYSSSSGWRRAIEIFNTTNVTGNLLLMKTGGNVGIGTTNPSTKLHIRQSADFDGITLTHAARAGIWKIYHSGTSSENIAFVQNDGTSDAVSYVAGRDLHNWYTGGTSKMIITSAGSVGVGTDDPVGKLSVSGGSGSRLLNVAEGSTARFLINGSTSSTDTGNAVFYTGAGFDASHYMVLQNNTDAYGRVGLAIRGKTFNGANTPSTNDGWNVASPRSGIRFEAYLSGDTGFDSKFAIQHLLTAGTNNSIGDLGFLAKGYSTTFPAVVLTAAGNVGIGSANPATKFVVVGSNTVATIESSTDYVDLQLANSQSSSGYIQYSGGNLRFFANSGSTPTLTITGGSPGRVGIGLTNPNEGFTSALTAYFSSAEPIYGGFGARSTGGTMDWNHATNARSGGGWSLLLGSDTNGPGPTVYFHPFSFEYSSKDGGGNMTQFAIGYNTTAVYLRYRYNNVWSAWTQL